MILEQFIEKHRCRQKRDECSDLNVIGRRGTIYEFDASVLAVTVMGAKNAMWWNIQREALKAEGCRITQNGNREGTALFDPENEEQVKAALHAIQAYHRRRVTPELLARLATARDKSPLMVQISTSDALDE